MFFFGVLHKGHFYYVWVCFVFSLRVVVLAWLSVPVQVVDWKDSY